MRDLLVLTAYRVSELVSDLLEVFQADPACVAQQHRGAALV